MKTPSLRSLGAAALLVAAVPSALRAQATGESRTSGNLRAPYTIREHGVLTVACFSGASQLAVRFESCGNHWVDVIDGVAEIRLPPNIGVGCRIVISDIKLPHSSTITVQVVAD